MHRVTPKQVHETEEKEKKKTFKFRQEATKHYEDARMPQKREDLIQSAQTDVINVVTPSIEKALDVQWQSTNVKFVRIFATSVAYARGRLKKVIIIKGPCDQACPRHTK